MQTADLLPRMIENPLDDALVRQLYPHYGDLPLPVIKEKFESPDGYLSYLQMNGCKADILSIAKSLMPFACSEKGYQKIQAMDCDTYVIKSPNEMMSFSQVAIIAQVASSIISTKKGFLNLYIKRKQLGIPLKLIFPAGNTCFIVLHKKNDRQDITGRDKRGRAALLCEVKEHIWSTKKIWNLTTIKGHSSLFYNARTIENTLVAAIRKPIFTKRLFDFDISNATYSKRSCYYPKYRSLFDCWIRNEYSENTMRLQRVLLNASKAICDLHEAGYVSGDLKEDNLLVDEMDAVILCDLDRVTAYKDSEKHFEYHTSDYAPPEAFTTEPKDGKKYDVFAFGCIMYSLVCNRMPVWFYKKRDRATSMRVRLDSIA